MAQIFGKLGTRLLPRRPADTALPNRVPPFVSNAAMPQIANYALVAGLGFFTAAAINQTGQANAAEYQFGLHAQAIHQAEGAKSSVWKSVPTPPAAVQPIPQRFVWSAPQSIDLTLQGFVRSSAAAPPATPQPSPLRLIFASQEPLDLSIGGWVVGGTQTPQGPVPPSIFASQDNPWQVPASVWKSVVTPPVLLGTVPATITALPQSDTTQIAAQVWKAQIAASITPNQTAPFFSIPPQTEDRQTRAIWQSLQAGQPLPTGAVPPLTSGLPQTDASQLAPQIWKSAPTPPVVLGVTVSPALIVPPQFDTSVNPTVIWTPSTFSPGQPVVIITPVVVQQGGYANVRGAKLEWREWETLKKKRKEVERKAPQVARIIEEIAEQNFDLAPALKALSQQLDEENLRQAKIYRELMKLEIERNRFIAQLSEDDDEEAITLLLNG